MSELFSEEFIIIFVIIAAPSLIFLTVIYQIKKGKKEIVRFNHDINQQLKKEDVDYLIGYNYSFPEAKIKLLVFEEDVIKFYKVKKTSRKNQFYYVIDLIQIFKINDEKLYFQHFISKKRLRMIYDGKELCDIVSFNRYSHTKHIFSLPHTEKYKEMVAKLNQQNKISAKKAIL